MSWMSERMFFADSVAPFISSFSSSMWALYSVKEVQMASYMCMHAHEHTRSMTRDHIFLTLK